MPTTIAEDENGHGEHYRLPVGEVKTLCGPADSILERWLRRNLKGHHRSYPARRISPGGR
jgi:hypothetical protein